MTTLTDHPCIWALQLLLALKQTGAVEAEGEGKNTLKTLEALCFVGLCKVSMVLAHFKFALFTGPAAALIAPTPTQRSGHCDKAKRGNRSRN